MPYSAQSNFDHNSRPKTGILLTNLGTPDAPTTKALRTYLKEFLSDPRVVEQPRWLWWLILNGIILNVRPAKSAAAYRSVWSEDGSPLMAISRRQRDKIAVLLQQRLGDDIHVELAMRYGNPSIRSGLESLREKGCRKLFVLPLYPQYSATTTASTFDAISDVMNSWRRIPALHFIDSYHDHPAYIDALAASVQTYWQQHGQPERLLVSFHGIPERYFRAGDPYPCHCRKTVRLLREKLGLNEEQVQLSFQSRFGREPWMQPYTDETLKQWGKEGVNSVDVICPGFAADCLETLEEIAVENRDYFLEAGGHQFRYIPALNDSDAHIEALARLLITAINGR
ncbi:ferrochelatase [Mariprofundus erugo]|uniref:Ferrochelatase n=1 Tax=Mariprofundus erugo TaxID=2528639 RepID=A0A5R9GMU4_9PROT|nr:ferrochelatase [Mariprofundus erugo]TLS66988.1 ferrochelatase [Mariprofundus erugo]TLS77311.1 ferrochelatase [Mariprofundus erugo]